MDQGDSLPKQSEQSSSAPDPFFDDSYSFHIHFFFLFIRFMMPELTPVMRWNSPDPVPSDGKDTDFYSFGQIFCKEKLRTGGGMSGDRWGDRGDSNFAL